MKLRKKPKRRGYVRPSREKPKTGWSARQLASLSGIGVRTIHLYLQQGVLPRPRFQGAATWYQLPQLLWLVAIRRLRAEESLSLAAIQKRLQALSPSELRAFATERLSPGPLSDALGVSPATSSVAAAPGLRVAPVGNGASPIIPRWSRIELALGLELHVRDDASPQVIELASRLRALAG